MNGESNEIDESAVNLQPGRERAEGRGFRLALLAVVVAGFAALLILPASPVHYGTALCGDEPFEVTKGWLWANHFPLYTRVWSDQPPLFSMMLGTLFKCFGPSILAARGLAMFFGLLLLGWCFILAGRRWGTTVAIAATASLLLASHVGALCVTPLQEVPAIALALGALWPVLRWRETGRWQWLGLSSLMVSVALQIKLTAAIMVPALAVEILLGLPAAAGMSRIKKAAQSLAIWGGTLAAGFVVLGWLCGASYDLMWKMHFSSRLTESPEAMKEAFTGRLVLDNLDAFAGAAAGLVMLAFRRKWRELAFPVVLLLTVMAVHFRHHPWWWYYYLHFAVPLAWLSGYGLIESMRFIWHNGRSAFARNPLIATGALVAAPALLSLWLVQSGARVGEELKGVHEITPVDDGTLAKMREYRDRTRWVYTESVIYPFHANLFVIPELGVVSHKRFWSGQITREEILATVKRYQPEQLLMGQEPLTGGWKDFISREYTQVHKDDHFTLYVINSQARAEDRPATPRFLEGLGLKETQAPPASGITSQNESH